MCVSTELEEASLPLPVRGGRDEIFRDRGIFDSVGGLRQLRHHLACLAQREGPNPERVPR